VVAVVEERRQAEPERRQAEPERLGQKLL